jgi:site-specific recombinase XerD
LNIEDSKYYPTLGFSSISTDSGTLPDTRKDFDAMNKRDIEALVKKIQNNGCSPRTVADYLTAIKAFWKLARL